MKILFTRFPFESSYGGAEVQTLSLMKGFLERGHAVGFIGSCPVLLSETIKLQIVNSKLQIGSPPVTTWHALSFFWRKKAMQEKLIAALGMFDKSVINNQQSETKSPLRVMFMLSLSEKLLLTEEAVKRGIKVFWIEHDRVDRWLTKNPWLPRLRDLSKSVTTITVSELSKKLYEDLGFANVIAIPNGIDNERFTNQKSIITNQKSTNTFHIGCIARLTEDKGVDLLIEAVADLPEVSLTIVGKGREEGYIRTLIAQVNERVNESTNKPINVLSSVPNLADFYCSLDLLVLPSRDNDPFGLVAAEAMMLGIPVIVTDQCGIADYLKDGEDALIVEANASRALKDGIIRMLDAAFRERIAEAGKRTTEERFLTERMVNQYSRLLIA